MSKEIDLLNQLGFSNHEANVYRALLSNPGLTVYQLSIDLSLSRSSLYKIVNKMYEDGYIVLKNGIKDHFYAIDPDTLLSLIESNISKASKALKPLLNSITKKEKSNNYINLLNYGSIVSKMKTMMLNAKKEIIMNTDLDLSLFDDVFDVLTKKNIRIVVFSFNKQEPIEGVEIYAHQCDIQEATRIMLVIDVEQVFIANNSHTEDGWVGTYTDNQFMVKVIYEHIHHDIYLFRIKQKLGVDLFELHPDIMINTINEKGEFF